MKKKHFFLKFNCHSFFPTKTVDEYAFILTFPLDPLITTKISTILKQKTLFF